MKNLILLFVLGLSASSFANCKLNYAKSGYIKDAANNIIVDKYFHEITGKLEEKGYDVCIPSKVDDCTDAGSALVTAFGAINESSSWGESFFFVFSLNFNGRKDLMQEDVDSFDAGIERVYQTIDANIPDCK